MTNLDRLIAEFCPDGVEYIPLGMIGKNLDSKRRPVTKGVRETGNYPYYGASGIVDYVSNYLFDGDYLLISEDGANLLARSTPIAFSASGKIWVNNHAHVLQFETYATRRYIEFYLSSIDLSRYISTAAQPKLNQENLNKIPIPLPPLPIQQEIVRILDNFTELTAELTAELEARKKQYEYYRNELLTFDDSVPMIELGEIAEFRYGFTDTAKDNGTARFIRITDIGENGKLQPTDCKYIDLSKDSENYLLKNGDLLMARTGATYGKTMLFEGEEPAVYASFLIRIRFADNTILPAYYWHFAQSSLYWKQANKLVSKAGQPQFNANALKNVLISVPSIDKQKRIIELLDRFDILSNDISSGLPAEITARQNQYEYYRDKLLTFKGIA